MRKIFLLLAALAALFCCHRPLFDNPSREGEDDNRVRPAPIDSTRGNVTVYATALVFPDTVDWRSGNSDGGRLVVFKDGVPVDTIGKYLDPAEPERIHFQEGHVWTDYTDGFETVIACDGQYLFSFPGEEKLMGFLVAGGEVHTLGQHPGGGVSYRVNGQEVFSSASGLVVSGALSPDWEGGALFRDETGVYYCYALPVSTETDQMWEYRVMKGAEVLKMIPAMTGTRLYDIRAYGGNVYRLDFRYGRVCFLKVDELTPMTLPDNAHEMSLVLVDGRMRVKGFHEEGYAQYAWIREADTLVTQYCNPHGQPVANLFTEDGDTAVVSMDYEECVVSIRRDTMQVTFPLETYRLQTPDCVRYRKGVIAAAMTGDLYVEENMIVINEKKYPSHFNGYFSGVFLK